MRRYFGRKLFIYLLTFWVAATIDWMIPRFMPGDPVQSLLSRYTVAPEALPGLIAYYNGLFGLDQPILQQYLNFWVALFHGNLGRSVFVSGSPVTDVIMAALPYTLALLIPAILLSWWTGNKAGAIAARRKVLDNTVLPVGYVLTATPYMWLAIMIAWILGSVFRVFPISGGYSYSLEPSLTWNFAVDLFRHWCMPFASLFLVMFGGWAIGMRNMIIYELDADYSRYLNALGAPSGLVRRVRVPQRGPAPGHRPGPAAGRHRGRRARDRDRVLVPGHRQAPPGGRPEPGLLPAAGHLPVHHHRRAHRQLPRRHRLRPDRPAHQGRHARGDGMSEPRRPVGAPVPDRLPVLPGDASTSPGAVTGPPGRPASESVSRRREILYFALRGRKVPFALGVLLVFFVIGIVGPIAASRRPECLRRPARRPALRRLLVRDHDLRPGRLRPVRPRARGHVRGGAPRRRRRGDHRDVRRVRRRATAAASSTRS